MEGLSGSGSAAFCMEAVATGGERGRSKYFLITRPPATCRSAIPIVKATFCHCFILDQIFPDHFPLRIRLQHDAIPERVQRGFQRHAVPGPDTPRPACSSPGHGRSGKHRCLPIRQTVKQGGDIDAIAVDFPFLFEDIAGGSIRNGILRSFGGSSFRPFGSFWISTAHSRAPTTLANSVSRLSPRYPRRDPGVSRRGEHIT